MRLHTMTGAVLTSVLVFAGCSGADSSETTVRPSEHAPSLSADIVLDRYVANVRPLQTVGSSDEDPETEFRQLEPLLVAPFASLTEGIDGCPHDIAPDTAVATGA